MLTIPYFIKPNGSRTDKFEVILNHLKVFKTNYTVLEKQLEDNTKLVVALKQRLEKELENKTNVELILSLKDDIDSINQIRNNCQKVLCNRHNEFYLTLCEIFID